MTVVRDLFRFSSTFRWGALFLLAVLLLVALWWLATPIIITVLIVVAFYLLSSALSIYLDPRTRLKNLVVKEAVAS